MRSRIYTLDSGLLPVYSSTALKACYTPMKELWQCSGLELGHLISQREVTSVEVVETFLARIEAINPTLNAIVTSMADQALEEARRVDSQIDQPYTLLQGVPISIKDVTDTEGTRTTYGSTYYASHVPRHDSILVERLRAAGLPLLGKTNTPEFGGKFDTENKVFGATLNPWHLDYSPGGSSGGAAAQVASGMGPLAHGNDGGGSIRVPASCCGVYGIKPQHGRIPSWPRNDGWIFLAHEGPITLTVRDAAALLDIMAGPDDRDFFSLPSAGGSFLEACDGDLAGLKIAWSPTPGYGRVDPEVQQLCEQAVRVFEDLGCHVEEATPDLGSAEAVHLGFILPRLGYFLEQHLPLDFPEKLDPALTAILPWIENITWRDLLQSESDRYALWDKLIPFFSRYDLFLTPTLATPPHRSGLFGPDQINGEPVVSLLEPFFTFPFNMTGQPAASIPVGFTKKGLPVGLQIVGRRFDEGTILRASARFEEARPWKDHWPSFQEYQSA